MVKFGMDVNIRTQKRWFVISASWSADNECRKYWWVAKIQEHCETIISLYVNSVPTDFWCYQIINMAVHSEQCL